MAGAIAGTTGAVIEMVRVGPVYREGGRGVGSPAGTAIAARVEALHRGAFFGRVCFWAAVLAVESH